MASSEYKGLIFDPNGGGAGTRAWNVRRDSPLAVDWVRSLANSWNHNADQVTQVAVNFTAVGVSAPGTRPSKTFTAANTYEHMISFGPFPWPIRHDLALMRPVYRLYGAVDNAAYTATFKPVFMINRDPLDPGLGLAYDELATSSTTEGPLTSGSATYLTITENNAYIRGIETVSSPESAIVDTAVAAQWLMCRLDIWVKATNAAATAYLSGCYLRAYVGT